jgi:hypothetical protein
LAPFVRVPAAVGNVTGQRVGSDMYVSFPVPAANKDGLEPADIGSLEVYAVTATAPPATEDQREVATLIATVPVRPILPELPVPENGSAPPVMPPPPGVDRAAPVVVKETITPELTVPVELPVERPLLFAEPEPDSADTAPVGPLVHPPPATLPRRHYFVIGVSPRGRRGDPSTPLSVPLETGSSAPGAPQVAYTETQMTVSWAPPADARTATFLPPPPPPKPVNGSPKAVPAPALLQARSLGFNSVATTYHLYAGSPDDPEPADRYDVKMPAPLTPQPVAATEHVITGITFGVERCFEVRAVDQVAGATVIGPASPRTCITPRDTFAPAAPRSLAVIAGPGVINLIWDANAEADLAGYLVLRGNAPGDTLQPITKEPVAAATYRDETVAPGTRYVYAVVAVDKAGNRSAESNRVEETAR